MPDLFFSSECIIQRNAYLQERKYKYHFDRLYLLYVVLCKIDKNIQNTQLHTNKIFAKSLIIINYHRKKLNLRCISSVQFSRSVVSDSLRPHESQPARPSCPSPTPGVHLDSRPSSQSCHPAISSSVVPFSSCSQSLPASESFPMSQLFA